MGIHKLLVVDDEDHLRGLFTLSDIERIDAESHQSVKPARDNHFRLMCGAAISTHRTADGELDRDRILGHVGKLVEEGVDAVAVLPRTVFPGRGRYHPYARRVRRPYPHRWQCHQRRGRRSSSLMQGANTIKIGQGPVRSTPLASSQVLVSHK